MKKIFTLWCLLAATITYAQTGSVGIGTTTPNPSAALDITASGKGLLIPRMDSVTRVAIANPPDGLMVFQNDGRKGFWYAISGNWLYIPDKATANDNLGNHSATQNVVLNDHDIQLRNTADSNQGLGWYGTAGSAKNWVGQNIDGPVLYGNIAGVLGTTDNGKKNILKWTRDGRIGIGTDNPSQALDIGTTSTPKPAFVRYQAGNGTTYRGWETGVGLNTVNPANATGENYDFVIHDVTGNTTPFMIEYASGKVGIGTIAPSEQLDVNGNARAQQFIYKTPQTHYLYLSADAFSITNGDYTPKTILGSSGINYGSVGTYLQGGTINNVGFLSASLNLPDGATITEMQLTAIDNDGTSITPTATISNFSPYSSGGVLSGAVTLLQTIGLTSQSASWQSVSIPVSHVVDNQNYFYKVVVQLNQNTSSTILGGVRIAYTVAQAD